MSSRCLMLNVKLTSVWSENNTFFFFKFILKSCFIKYNKVKIRNHTSMENQISHLNTFKNEVSWYYQTSYRRVWDLALIERWVLSANHSTPKNILVDDQDAVHSLGPKNWIIPWLTTHGYKCINSFWFDHNNKVQTVLIDQQF